MTLKIDYFTEPVEDYVNGLTKQNTKSDLVKFLKSFKPLTLDAIEAAEQITNFREFQRGLRSERRKIYSGDAWATKYGAILMPLVMWEVSMIQAKFVVPWGLAYHRLIDVKRIVLGKDGYARLQEPPKDESES